MNELSIEQKANRYDEALEKSKRLYEQGTITESLAYIFPELRESDDEMIRKAISDILLIDSDEIREILDANNVLMQDIVAWLEKQSKHANFLDKIQIGDKVTRNEDGMLVNLSQLKRVAKPADKQGEQKPAWSKENDNIIEWLIGYLEYQIMNATITEEKNNCLNAISILKSLKDRYTWKPSDEQMIAVQEAMNIVGILTITGSKINSLYQDLKKLKE